MKLIELIQQNPSQEYLLLKEKFPTLYKLTYEIEIIPWQEEYAIADRNPDELDIIESLESLLEKNQISFEEFQTRRQKLNNYVSKTLAIAFIDTKQISFREKSPPAWLVIHELGHVYFKVNDLIWNATLGGGEVLLWLSLKNKYKITEQHIHRYHRLLKQTFKNPELVHRYIVKRIAPKINVYPHLFPICLYAGTLPLSFNNKIIDEIFANNLLSSHWKEINITPAHLFSFFQNLIAGLQYQDPYSITYAYWLKIID